ncbi:DUF2141 domain-containing protein [Geomonas sp. Red32]|uniref:DUF2141 domain-containing protein n=1 Tax=Geomonas sp. Red32 TaxID=2912856 RepID=UPI00202CB0F1|nr:DUF2141 domain-containing protein [Geomonas sp. Red32]MCM0084409.1 DUF2141 domain-containing protein [Geomonas sp. Red32]
MSSPVKFLPCCLLLLAIAVPAAYAETLKVRIAGLKDSAGEVVVMVWKDAAGFPSDTKTAVAHKRVRVTGTAAEVTIGNLPRGVYAVAAYQDLNSNGEMDRSVFGWPVEPVGASRGAKGRMGPPRFRDAAFELKEPVQEIEIKVK